MNSPKDTGNDRHKRWWTALGGMVAFAALGIVLAPGFTSRVPAPDVEPTSHADRPGGRGETKQGGPRGALPPQVPATRPNAGDFDCMILPNEVIDVGSAITGVIDSIDVERSDSVEAGQVLARLESSVERAAVRVARARAERKVDLDSSKARLNLGRKRRNRALQLFDNSSLSLDLREEVETQATIAALEVERAREDHRIASLQLEQAVAALELRTIRSPVAGVVVERLMAPGEVVDEETILRLAQVDPLRVEVILPTDLFNRVQAGDRAEILPEPPLDQPRVAEVAIVDRVIDGASGTFGARLLLANPDRGVPAGLRCQLSFLDDASVPAEPPQSVASAEPTQEPTPAD